MHPGEEKSHTAYLSVGSNIGENRSNCEAGISALSGTGYIDVVDQSPFYRTAPVDYEDQDWFVNCVVKIRTQLSPAALLNVLQGIEKDAGRSRKGIRYGPRILDMDILLYGVCVLMTPELIIPHPRMHKRRFVLGPFCDINPDVVHPVLSLTVQELLTRIDPEIQRMIPY